MLSVRRMWINQTSREQFVDFLLEAKRTTYAGQGDEATVTPLVPGSKQLEYRDGDYLYRDIYFGMAYFVGQEVVFHREQAVWSMSYAGGVMPRSGDNSDTRAIYAFLRLALRHGGKDEPYRGPAAFTRDFLTYTNSNSGSLAIFSGVEGISREGAQIYECRYAGGLLR
jgi:hypothetical protein